MTQTGSIMGTAQYLSPEQAQGHAVSAASDLYSIGIMLYELLTGRVPVRRRERGDDRAQAGVGDAAAAERRRTRRHARARGRRAARAGEGPGPPLRRRRRVHRRARGRPLRRGAGADDRLRARRRSSRCPLRRPSRQVHERRALVEAPPPRTSAAGASPGGSGRWRCCSSSARSSRAPRCWSAATRSQVPNVVGADRRRRRARAAPRGLRDRDEHAQRRRAARHGHRPGPAGGQPRRGGLDGDADVSDGPGRRARARPSTASPSKPRRPRLERAGFKVERREQASDSVEHGRVISSTPAEGGRGRARQRR